MAEICKFHASQKRYPIRSRCNEAATKLKISLSTRRILGWQVSDYVVMTKAAIT